MIDAHLHLWNTGRLPYEWLQRPENAAINRTFGFRGLQVTGRTSRGGSGRPGAADDTAADTEAMFEVAAHPEIAGVVAWVPLDRPDEAAAQLRQLEARPGFAGIRNLIHDQPDPDWLLPRRWGRARAARAAGHPVRRDRRAAQAPQPRTGAVRAVPVAADGP
ncbi:MAG: amidohydrolase family protein [Streptosporangiaceae bacterium]